MKNFNESKRYSKGFLIIFINIVKHFIDIVNELIELICFCYKYYFVTKKTFYFPNEIWDQILLYNGIQKIQNYEELLKIDTNLLIQSYSSFNTSVFVLEASKYRHIHKIEVFISIKRKIKKYIENNFDNLVKENSLKNALLYFHIKNYVTFLSEYSTFVPLEINVNVMCNHKSFHIFFLQYMKLKQISTNQNIPELEPINNN